MKRAANRTCGTKVRHKTREIARAHALALRMKGGARVSHYKCPYCGGWHVGHTPRGMRGAR